jgi:beta-galactosidase
MNVNHLLFGAAYYDEYMPYDRIEQDMAMMKKAGMNVIRIAESTWSTLEPQEGVYDFRHLDRMLATSARYGIQVIIGTPTYAIPTWLAKKSPDVLAFTKNGQEIYGHRQNMDITNPVYRKYAENIIRTLLKRVQGHSHVIGYQIDNETKHYDTAGIHAQELFVTYLQELYPNIDDFNHEFGLDYWSNRVNDWSDFPDVRGTINGSLAAEYEKFKRKLVTDFFHWQASIIEEYKTPEQFVTQNFDFEWHGTSYGLQPDANQYDAVQCMSVAGADIYHPSQDELTGAEITVCGNIARGLKRDNYLILETQAQGNLAWLPYPGQLRLCAYSHIANGANSVMYWHWHSIHNAIESYWKGVLSHDFSENATYQEACSIGAEFNRYGSHLKNLKKANTVAVLLDHESLTGLKEFPTGSLSESSYNSVVRWLCDSLYRANVEYDVIFTKEMHLVDYSLVLVPSLYSASEDTLQQLNAYTENGGHLVVTFRGGFSDEHLKIYSDMQPHILHQCLGVSYNQFTIPRNTTLNCSFSDSTSSIHDWMELLIPDTAVSLAQYISPAWGEYAAITQNAYGEGIAYYLGCFFDDTTLDALMGHITKQAGILPSTVCYPVIQKHGINDFGKHVYYYFNYSQDTQTVTYDKEDGCLLMENQSITAGDSFKLAAWDVKIIEAL